MTSGHMEFKQQTGFTQTPEHGHQGQAFTGTKSSSIREKTHTHSGGR